MKNQILLIKTIYSLNNNNKEEDFGVYLNIVYQIKKLEDIYQYI